MTVIAGLVLLGLVLYVSMLDCALPLHSRARLTELLGGASRERRLAWLDTHEGAIHAATCLLRLALSLGLLVTVWRWHTSDLGYPSNVVTGASAFLVTLILLAIFAVAVPQAVAWHAPEPVLARGLRLLWLIHFVLWPFGRLSSGIEFIVRRLLGKTEAGVEVDTERAEQEILDAVSEGEAYGAVDEDQKEMIESVIELGETAVSAIMTPRTDIDAVPADASYDDARAMILEKGHSRIPVYEGTIDHISGVLYAKDLLRLDPGEPFDARRVMRTVPYVPQTKTLDELLEEFRSSKVQIAIVLDEYGGTAGLCTIEDILEELVGEIDDEYDQAPPPAVNRIDDDTVEVDARVHVSQVNEELAVELPEEEDYETIGGFVFATLGKIPATGEEFEHGKIRFRVVEAEPRRIKRLRIHVPREKAAPVE